MLFLITTAAPNLDISLYPGEFWASTVMSPVLHKLLIGHSVSNYNDFLQMEL